MLAHDTWSLSEAGGAGPSWHLSSDRIRHAPQPLTLRASVDGLLDRLYAQHSSQDESVAAYFTARAADGTMDWNNFDARTNEFLKDKLIALDRSKAEFCYHLCRALRARRIVEAMEQPKG